jgi:AcrR family transcriptional regulator
MHIPSRLIRDKLKRFTNARRPEGILDLERRAQYLDAAETIFAEYGRPAITLRNLAEGLYISPSTLRRHFADLDQLLADLIIRHLNRLNAILAAIDTNAPDHMEQRRAAYFANTRNPTGGYTDAHAITLRDRATLPADLAEGIETLRIAIGYALGGNNNNEALALLDSPMANLVKIEIVMQALAQPIPEAVAAVIEQRVITAQQPKPKPSPHPAGNVLDCDYSPGARCLDTLFNPKPHAKSHAPPRGP